MTAISERIMVNCCSMKIIRLRLKILFVLLAVAGVFMVLLGINLNFTASVDSLSRVQRAQPVEHAPSIQISANQKLKEFLKSYPNSAEYCNPPIKPVTGDEGLTLEGLQLESLHIILRHGDRASMPRQNEAPFVSLNCQLDPQQHDYDPLLLSFIKQMSQIGVKFPLGNDFNGYSLFPNKKQCGGADLTSAGVLQLLKIGKHLKEVYLQYINNFWNGHDFSKIEFISTRTTRTYMSMVALLFGFLPEFKVDDIKIRLSADLTFCSPEILGYSCECPKLKLMGKTRNIDVSNLNSKDEDLKKFKQDLKEMYDFTSLTAAMDYFMQSMCHARAPPCGKNNKCITPAFLKKLWTNLDNIGKRQITSSKYTAYERLHMHPLLYRIAKNMEAVSLNKGFTKTWVFSGHDVTLTPLSIALGFNNGKWPPYASRIIFEMYSWNERDLKKFGIRVLFNGENVTKKVKFCNENLEFGQKLCPLESFKQFVEVDSLKYFGGSSYGEVCGQNLMMKA